MCVICGAVGCQFKDTSLPFAGLSFRRFPCVVHAWWRPQGRLLTLSLAVPAVAFALGLPFAAWGAVHGMPYMDNVWAVLAGAALSVGGVFAVFRLRAGRTVTDVFARVYMSDNQ